MPLIEDTFIILCCPEQDYLRLILDLLCACVLNVFPWKIENSNIRAVWDAGKCVTDHSLYSWSEHEQCPCHYMTKNEKKRKGKKPKGYKQEATKTFYTTCYWLIVTCSLLLSCHCILNFNKIWANIRGHFFAISGIFFWKVSNGILNVIHNVMILQCDN